MNKLNNSKENFAASLSKQVNSTSNLSSERNPVLNSAEDITDELLEKIINNDLDSLTINNEFTRSEIKNEDRTKYLNEIAETNQFKRANKISPLRRIEFEIVLTPNVKSLAFAGFEELEYVNLKDTSNVSDMASMFKDALLLICQSAIGIRPM